MTTTTMNATTRRTVLEGGRGWRAVDLREIWRARDLIALLAWRDIRVRYKQTALGASWALIQPLATMAVFAGVFGRMSGGSADGVPYPLFVLAGVLPWGFFAASTSNAGASVVGSERLISKVYFPRMALPIAALGAASFDFLVGSVVLALGLAISGVVPGAGIVLAPLILAAIATGALGLGSLLAALSVAHRDFKHAIPFLLQVGLFATPAAYLPRSARPTGRVGALVDLNPMNALIDGFRASILGGPIPWGPVALASTAALALLLVGCAYFRKVEDDFADLL